MPPRIIQSVLLLLTCHAAIAQTAESAAFEVASVKPAAPQPNGRQMSMIRGGPGTADPGRFSLTGMTLGYMISRAYDVKNYQITGPSWMESERYDVVAKVPAGATPEQFRLMLQNLLAERFHLTLHHETKELQGYDLVLGKNGSKLKISPEADSAASVAPPTGPPLPPGPPKLDSKGFPQMDRPGLMMMFTMGGKGGPVARMIAKAQPMTAFIQSLAGQMRAPVQDKTGLTGKYDFTLEFAPEGMQMGGGGPPGQATGPSSGQGPLDNLVDSGPTLLSAIQDQLGLKLEAKKGPVDMLVIDRADKVPTEN